MAGVFSAVASGCGSRPSSEELACRDASTAARWQDAAAICTHAAGTPDRLEMVVLAARALVRIGKTSEAMAMAERGFGTAVDGTARQIVGIQRIQDDRDDEAQTLLVEALRMHRAAGDHLESTRDAYWLAGSFLHQRRLAEAIDAANTSVLEAQLAGERRYEGYAYRAQADVLTAIGDADAARSALVEAGAILSAWPQDIPWVLLKHGMLVLQLDDVSGAVSLLTKALEAAERAGLATVVDAAKLNLARAEHALGHLDAAQRYLDALNAQTRATPTAGYVAGLVAASRGDRPAAKRLLADAAASALNDDYAADIAYEQGVLAEHDGNVADARGFYRAAIGVIEDMRVRTATLELRPWMLARRRAPYEALFVLLATQHENAEALEVAERLHARAWLDVVVAAAVPRDRLSLQTMAAAAPLSTDQLLAAASDREILIYVNARGALWRVHIDSERVGSQVTGRHTFDIAQLPDEVGPRLAAWRDHFDDLALAQRLGDLLIPDDLLPSTRPLYLVASDGLAQVPFAALRRSQRAVRPVSPPSAVQDSQYLVADRPLVRLPGLAALRCRSPRPGFGPPVLLADSRDNLPCARQEVAHAARIVQGRAYLGRDATVGQAASARNARLFHAAVHAVVGPTGGALDLADGRLGTAEIITRGIQPRVAVLAGCATGVSNDNEGWGALPSAFLAAGTQTVVATLRPVEDSDAALVMRGFYEAGGAEHPVVALASAQRDLAAGHAPHVWAWFAAWGHAEPDDCRSGSPQAAP